MIKDMSMILNPILTGFHPDPSILRVGEDYYIATSTFEWFPGVMIYHSKNLAEWELIACPLNDFRYNMEGIPPSGGVWAPCLSYSDGLFYLVYTIVHSYDGIFKDCRNYLITSNKINGQWSEPVFLHSIGFDPSLYHDIDGRKWLVSMQQDFGYNRGEFGGIVIQEYDVENKIMLGEPELIFKGTKLGNTEGPHIYYRQGYYYLLVAEGGTEYDHAVSVARSKNVNGYYSAYENNPIMTTREVPQFKLQKAGHGSLVETKDGDWYMAHLCARPIGMQRMCILGRETALQKVGWKGEWPELSNGTSVPELEVPINISFKERKKYYFKEDFDKSNWDLRLQTLRCSLGKRASCDIRPGYLRLYGGESLQSNFQQSILAHRQQFLESQVTTTVAFAATDFRQMAGLIYYYDNQSYFYLFISRNREKKKVLNILSMVMGRSTWPLGDGILIPENEDIYLRLRTYGETAQYFVSVNGKEYESIGPKIDAVVLSDDYYYKFGQYRFTGAFIGLCCQDLTGREIYADFDFYEYREM